MAWLARTISYEDSSSEREKGNHLADQTRRYGFEPLAV
jgi:hypothetical protein